MTDVAPLTARVSMRRALSAAYRYAFSRFVYVMRISWPIFAMFIALGAFQIAMHGQLPAFKTAEDIARNPGLFAATMALGLAFIILISLFQLAVFILVARDYFLGERPARFWHVYGAVLGRVLLLTLLCIALGIAFMVLVAIVAALSAATKTAIGAAIAIITVIAAVIGAAYVFSRWATWPLSHAVERPQTLGEAWRSTAGAAFKIFAGFLIIGISFLLVAVILVIIFSLGVFMSFPPVTREPGVADVLLSMGQLVLSQLGLAIQAVFIADIFRQLRSSS